MEPTSRVPSFTAPSPKANFPTYLPVRTHLAHTTSRYIDAVDASAKMYQARNIFLPMPIARIPVEILIEIFKIHAESHPEIDHPGTVLRLVNKYWDVVASHTPCLWTKINIFPFPKRRFNAAVKWIHATNSEKIDVAIYFRHPDWDCDTYHNSEIENRTEEPANELVGVQNVMVLLRDTEKRWRSIKVVSQTWLPLYKFMQGWTFTHLPSLESISMERENPYFALYDEAFYPERLRAPVTLFGRNASLPKLRDLSLSAVHVDWNDAPASYRSLRKLELRNLAYDTGPSFEQFGAMLSSSPRLEYLDVSGFCPEPEGDPEIPVVYLPALRDFTFGWKDHRHGGKLLQMFQIGSSLESLTLKDAQHDFVASRPVLKREGWIRDSSEIFKALHDLGKGTPPGPFISMRGVRSLRIIWTKTKPLALVPLIEMLTELEDIWLEDVDGWVLADVASVLIERGQARRQLRLALRWAWRKEVSDFAKSRIKRLKDAGIRVTAQAGGAWHVG